MAGFIIIPLFNYEYNETCNLNRRVPNGPMLVSPEYRFVLHKILEEKCSKQAKPFLMWLKVACATVELPIRKQPK